MRTNLGAAAVLAALGGAVAWAADGPPASQPAVKWYLSPDYLEDPGHAPMIARAQARAAVLDERGIEVLVDAATLPKRSDDDHWTLVVLEDRAVPAMVRALSDPEYHALTSPYDSSPEFKTVARLNALWARLESFAPASAVPTLANLVDHADRPVREFAAMALGSIGRPACAEPIRRALRSDDEQVRSWALIGLEHGLASRRADPMFLAAVFDDVAAVVGLRSTGGSQAPQVLLKMDRDRAAAFLQSPQRFGADHREIGAILSALADSRVTIDSGDRVVQLLDELEQQPRLNTTAYGAGLKLLALAGHPSAAARIERALAYDAPDTDLTRNAQYHRELAASAYLTLHGIPDAYQVAIDKWGGPGDLARLPEPVRHYATVHVLNNEICNGGVSQYFFNSYAEDVQAALAGLDAIGAKESAKILREAIADFGKDGPSADREKRQAQLEELVPAAFEGLDDRWYADTDRLDVLLARFAAQHKAHFQSAPARP